MKLKILRKGGTALLPVGNRWFVFVMIMLSYLSTKGQTGSVVPNYQAAYSFINFDNDTITNAAHLKPFFDKLLKLQHGDTSQISIVHIGDSHIQADFLTREVRKNLQMQFGNAGRGLVFPLRVAGTNEPNDYRSTTNTRWSMAKVNSAARLPEPGISGISIFSDLNGSFFDISTFDHDGLDYSFNQVTLIHTKDSMQFDCRISDSPPKYGYLMSAQSFSADDCTSWVAFTHTTNYVLVQSEQTEAAQQSFTINGLVLSNGKPGILYHSIGINGARYSDYNNSPLFFKQLKILNPDLVIISLGTNEGANVKVNGEETIAAITSMIHSIRSLNPSTCILIATPTDDYWRKKYKNPYLESVERSLLKSVEMENVACWDMYNITGGYGSCVRWRKAKLMQRDGVHFNKEGYTLQGYLLYKAIIDSFSRYAAH